VKEVGHIILGTVSIINVFFIILIVFFDKKKPESTLAWILILFFVPYVGAILYIVFGEFFRFSVRKKERDKILNDELLHSENVYIEKIEDQEKLSFFEKLVRWFKSW
jgi:cardiolipin synthase